jgi:hypothetical protein
MLSGAAVTLGARPSHQPSRPAAISVRAAQTIIERRDMAGIVASGLRRCVDQGLHREWREDGGHGV